MTSTIYRKCTGLALRNAFALVLIAACACAGIARAANEEVTLNFVNTDIEAVATAIGQITKRNFLIDPRVKGTVNIVSSRPVPASAIYDIFLSALRLQGFAAVEANGITKIMLEADAKLHLNRVTVRNSAGGDRLLTQIYTLKYASANQLLPVLRPIISPANTIVAYTNNNSLIITDYADNLRRIDLIVDALDRPGGGEPVVIPLRYAAAAEMAQTLGRLLAEGAVAPGAQPAADPSTRVVIVPDSRTNSIVVRSENPERIARVQAIVKQLDVPTGAGGNIHVIYLKNAEATRVAQTLRAILSGEASIGPVASAPPLPGSAAPLPGGAPLQQVSAASTGGSGIVADPASNAVIISAPDAIVAHLKSVIDKLDVRRAQVYVEALIVELTADRAAEFGIQWQSINELTSNASRSFGGTNFGARGSGTNIIDASINPGNVGPGINVGVVKGQITLPGIGTIANLGALARALATDANANILSTPNLLTLDNEEAKIVIGQNVPFITGQYAQTGSATTATPFQTIERRDVGLTLRIRPQISEGGAVRLQIFQEVSSVQNLSNVAGIITNKRAVESTVLVDDGQIVALGGLVQDSTTTTVDRVPLLGDIPLIGGLFRYDTRKQTKTNLMVFLRPLVMRDSTAYGGVTTERYRQLLGEQEKAQPPPHPILPDFQGPRLPPLPPAAPAAK
jgi:general secretion pathway protein D